MGLFPTGASAFAKPRPDRLEQGGIGAMGQHWNRFEMICRHPSFQHACSLHFICSCFLLNAVPLSHVTRRGGFHYFFCVFTPFSIPVLFAGRPGEASEGDISQPSTPDPGPDREDCRPGCTGVLHLYRKRIRPRAKPGRRPRRPTSRPRRDRNILPWGPGGWREHHCPASRDLICTISYTCPCSSQPSIGQWRALYWNIS